MKTERELELKFCQCGETSKKKKKTALSVYEKGGPFRNLIVGSDAEIIFDILLGNDFLENYEINNEGGE